MSEDSRHLNRKSWITHLHFIFTLYTRVTFLQVLYNGPSSSTHSHLFLAVWDSHCLSMYLPTSFFVFSSSCDRVHSTLQDHSHSFISLLNAYLTLKLLCIFLYLPRWLPKIPYKNKTFLNSPNFTGFENLFSSYLILIKSQNLSHVV